MTSEQAANRQADHENLIRELVDALEAAVLVCEGNGPLKTYLKVVRALDKAKEQGYA